MSAPARSGPDAPRIPWAAIGRHGWAATVWSAGKAATAASFTGRAALRYRSTLVALLARGAWVVALLLLVDAGRTLFDVTARLPIEATLQQFAIGFAICTAIALLGAGRHIRWGAIALGTVHGALGLLLYAAAGPMGG